MLLFAIPLFLCQDEWVAIVIVTALPPDDICHFSLGSHSLKIRLNNRHPPSNNLLLLFTPPPQL